MKLHLPKGLRAALLAVFSLVATTYSANARIAEGYDPNAAYYGYKVEKLQSGVIEVDGDNATGIKASGMDESWVISISGVFGAQLAVYKEGEKNEGAFYGGCVIAGNIDVPFYVSDLANDRVQKPKGIKKNQFAVYYTPDGDICIVTSSGVKRVCSTGYSPGLRYNNPIQISLNWIYDEETDTGSLYLLNVSKATSTLDTGEPFTTERIAIFENVSLTDTDMGVYGGIYSTASSAVSTSKLAITEYKPGTGVNNRAWIVTGIADVQELKKAGVKNEYGKADYPNMEVQLTGSKAGLMLTEKNTTFELKGYLSLDNNILNGDMGTSLRFGAEEGSTLYVRGDALASNDVLSGNSLHIMGPGTVKLDLNVNSGENNPYYDADRPETHFNEITNITMGSMAAGSTLELQAVMYTDVNIIDATIGKGASIIRNSASTGASMTFRMNNTTADGQTFEMGTVANDNGRIIVIGGQEKRNNKGDKILATYSSTLNADTLRAAEGSINLYGGVYNIKDLIANTGNSAETYSLSVGQYDANWNMYHDYQYTKLNVTGTLTANADVYVAGSAHLGSATTPNVIFAYDSAYNNTLSADSINAYTIKINLEDINNPLGNSKGDDIPTIPADVDITSTHGNQDEIITGGFSASVSGKNATITAGNIKDSDITITAGEYDEEKRTSNFETEIITHRSIQSTVFAAEASDINFTFINSKYVPADATTGTGESWQETSTTVLTEASGTSMLLSSAGLSASTLDATSIALPNATYGLTANSVTADTLTSPSNNFAGEVEMKNVRLIGNSIAATSISATNMELGASSSINSSVAGELLKLNAEESIVIGEKSTINNAYISTGTGLTVNNETLLNNTTLKGVVKTNGTVTFKSAGLSGMNSTFGGADGDAFIVDHASAGIDSIDMDAVLNGSTLNISRLTVKAEGLVFDETATGTSYDVLCAENGKGSIDYEIKSSNWDVEIQPWVRAKMTMNNGVVTLNGRRDEEGIKDELRTSENRSITIDAIDELKDIVSGNVSTVAAEEKSAFQTIHDYLGHVHRYTQDQREKVLDAVSGASLTALADSQRRGIADVQSNLRNRVIQMGGGTNDGYNTEWAYNGLQAWAQADGGLASVSGGNNAPGYDFNTTGATVGANLDVTNNLVMGVSFSVSYGEITSDNTDHAKGNNDAQYFSFFARHQSSRWVQMLILTAGKNEMDLERNVLGYSAKGDTKGSSLSAYYELGYTMGLDYEYTHIIQPLVSIRYTSAEIDKFSESGTLDDLSLDYNSKSLSYGSVAIGARYQGVVYTSVHERNAVAEARVLVSQDFGDKTDEAEVAFADGTKRKVKGTDTTGVGLEIGGGLSIPVQQHTTLYADADVTFNGDYNAFRANIGLRYDF